MISQVIIDPGHGYRNGKYDHGRRLENIDEATIVDMYRHTMEEELMLEGVRYYVQETRQPKTPIRDIPDNSLVLSLHTGWNPLNSPINMSQVLYNSDAVVAEQIADLLFNWGKRAAGIHGNGGVKKVDDLGQPNCIWVEIQPLMINGPGIDRYVKYLPELGALIGRFAAAYAKANNSTLGFKPRQVPERAAVSRRTVAHGHQVAEPTPHSKYPGPSLLKQ